MSVAHKSMSLACSFFCLGVRTHCGSHSKPSPQNGSLPHVFANDVPALSLFPPPGTTIPRAGGLAYTNGDHY